MSILIAILLLTLPWLNPFTWGPMPAVGPWLFSMVCLATVFGLAASAATGMDRQTWVRAIAGAWLVAALLSAAIGLVQYFGASSAFTPWINNTTLGEAYGNLRQRNQFATLMAIGMAALVWWVMQGGALRFAAVAAALLAMGSAASASRTGLLQWAIFIGFAANWRGERRVALRYVLLIAAVVYAIATLGLPWLAGLDPMSSGAWARLRAGDAACMGRITLWSNVLHLIAQKPWFGWGWGELDYAHFVTLYPGARFCDILDNAHNLPLHLAVELGLPIAAAVCGAGLWLVLRAKPWREVDPTRQMAWGVLALLMLHSLLEYPMWYGPFQIAAGLSVWLLCQPHGATTSWSDSKPFMPLARVSTSAIAIILIAICGYTAWDYWRISQLYIAHAERSSAYRDNTLDKLQGSWLFRNQVQFAELTTMQLGPSNAARAFDLAGALLHFSPEPRVVEKLIESAVMLGRDEEAAFYMERYKAAFPEAYRQWVGSSTRHKTP